MKDFNCAVDYSLSRDKTALTNIKTVLSNLGQDTSCIDNIIACFPDYSCENVENRNVPRNSYKLFGIIEVTVIEHKNQYAVLSK